MQASSENLKLAIQSLVGKRMPDVNSWQTTLAIVLNSESNVENTVASIASKALLTNKEVADSLKSLINSGFKMARDSRGNLVFNIGNNLKYVIKIPQKKDKRKETGSMEIFVSTGATVIENREVKNVIMDKLIQVISKKDLVEIDRIISENEIDWEYTDSSHNGVLSVACSKNNISILSQLIKKGLNAQNGLMWACQNGNKYRGLIAFFIKHGADANIGENLMPLQWAIFTGAVGLAQELIENGADINYVSDSGEPILQMAVDSDNKQVVELLLMRGVSLDVSNSTGDGPLHWAVTTGASDIIKMLTFADCPLMETNYAGKTPYELAVSLGKENAISILEKHQKK